MFKGTLKGGRVHWLIWNLPPEFKNSYRLFYNYASHNYMFYRNKGFSIYDIFIVVRTSKRCFRVSYVNTETSEFQTFSCTKSKHAAHRMWYIFKIDQKRKEGGSHEV